MKSIRWSVLAAFAAAWAIGCAGTAADVEATPTTEEAVASDEQELSVRYVPVTVAQLERYPERYAGRRVRVVAEPSAELAACTLMACVPDNPCCNRCSANYQIGRSITLEGRTPGANFGCAGNSCDWSQSCRPFPSSKPGRYELRGVFEVREEGAAKVLRVEGFRALNCQKGGCSSQLCVNTPGVVSTCEWRPEYACYRDAACTSQRSGNCGWTQTPELRACLARPPSN